MFKRSRLLFSTLLVCCFLILRNFQRKQKTSVIYVNSTRLHYIDKLIATGEKRTSSEHHENYFVDLPNFSYLQQQEACSKRIRVLILVHSAPGNFVKRRMIRDTWANKRIYHLESSQLRVLFLLGAVENVDLHTELLTENAKHADMVQGSFLDSYRNMTYKHVMALKWFRDHCNNASSLIKLDDDVFLNTAMLFKYASYFESDVSFKQQHPTSFPHELALSVFGIPTQISYISCYSNISTKVQRTFHSKWRVSFREYRKKFYPKYCAGFAIIYPSLIVERLFLAAQTQPYFWIDDVHITGFLRQLQGIALKFASKFFLNEQISSTKNLTDIEFLFIPPGASANYAFQHHLAAFPQTQL